MECIKRRLLFAAAETYGEPEPDETRKAGWLSPPVTIEREKGSLLDLADRMPELKIDRVLVGRIAEGILVAFRGTLPPRVLFDAGGLASAIDWINSGSALLRRGGAYPGRVHEGFSESLQRLWDDGTAPDGMPETGLEAELNRLLADGGPRRLFITGHSKGGALAVLFAWRASETWPELRPQVMTIAAPRAGDGDFAAAFAGKEIDCLRYEVEGDLVPSLPFGADTPAEFSGPLGRLGVQITDYVGYAPVGVAKVERLKGGFVGNLIGRIGAFFTGGGFELTVAKSHFITKGARYDKWICAGDGCAHDWARAE